MGDVRKHRPVLLMAAVVSRFEDAFVWAREQMVQQWGPIHIESKPFEFDLTTFYEASMGSSLKKQFFAFQTLVDPAEIAAVKVASNKMEQAYAEQHDGDVDRPLNVDPGYVTEAKLVLATTKDRDHRIYLNDGIFAEVTLHFRQGEWRRSRWTYPDYQLPISIEFLNACREWLRSEYRR